MAQVQITDVVVPAEFTAYQVENSLVSTALFQSGVAVPNGEMASQLSAGAQSFSVPFWADLSDVEADIANDDPTINSTAQKVAASMQIVRKSFLHASWSEMSLASELSGSDALVRVQNRVQAYWDRQYEKRLVASLRGVLLGKRAAQRGEFGDEQRLLRVSHGSRFVKDFDGCASHVGVFEWTNQSFDRGGWI
jgi:hypothetical protein